MNIGMWVVAGGMLGWAGYAVMRLNERRGMMISILIGMAGGFFGGNVIAPMLGAITGTSGDFSLLSLAVASASAVACLAVGNLLSTRLGV